MEGRRRELRERISVYAYDPPEAMGSCVFGNVRDEVAGKREEGRGREREMAEEQGERDEESLCRPLSRLFEAAVRRETRVTPSPLSVCAISEGRSRRVDEEDGQFMFTSPLKLELRPSSSNFQSRFPLLIPDTS